MMQSNNNYQNSSHNDEPEETKIRAFQRFVRQIAADIIYDELGRTNKFNFTERNKKSYLIELNGNPDSEGKLPFIINEETMNEDEKKCLQKLNELYLEWIEKGGKTDKSFEKYVEGICSCILKFVGKNDQQVHVYVNRFKRHQQDAKYSCEQANKRHRNAGKNCPCNLQ